MGRKATNELDMVRQFCLNAEQAIGQLEHADWITAGEGSTADVRRLQAKRHGVSLVRSFVEGLQRLNEEDQ
jgi:hypothetical protein